MAEGAVSWADMTEPANRRRVDRILDSAYVEALDRREIDDLRLMRAECGEVETEFSYVRRLAQARLEILRAEIDRRERGGDLGDLVESLPRILAGDSPPTDIAGTRVTQSLAPSMSINFDRGLEHLISDSTLVNLPNLSEAELGTTIGELTELEREVSGVRRELHAVMDRLDVELGARLRTMQQSS